MITWENYEEYMMMHADGELSAADEQALTAFISAHPELKNELNAYDLTILKPDANIVFENKSSLLKTVAVSRTIAFPRWRSYSVAAGIAAILVAGVWGYRYQSVPMQTSLLAGNSSSPAIDTASPKKPAKTIASIPQTPSDIPVRPAAAANRQLPVRNAPARQVASITGSIAYTAATHKVTIASHNSLSPKMANPRREKTEAATLPVAALKIVPVHPLEDLPGDIAVPEIVTVAATTEQRRSLWDMLPLNKENRQELKAVAAAVADKYEQINTIKQNLQEKNLTIRVEKRKLIISF